MTLTVNPSVDLLPGDVVVLHTFDPHAGEVFQQHPEHAHLMVSDQGRVWSSKARRFVGYKSGPQGGRANGRNNYLRVNTGGTPRTKGLHVLVMETFVGPVPEGHEVDHINHDSMDNRRTNLRFRLIADNRADVWDERDIRNDTAWTGSTYGV